MKSDIDWAIDKTENQQDITLSETSLRHDALRHMALCSESSEHSIQAFINSTIDHAIAIIPQCIRDDARYLIFTWNSDSATLNIVSTDDDKRHDANECVEVSISQWREIDDSKTDAIHFWIKDHLSTSSEFFRYSLIAVFCLGDRSKAQLL